MSWTQELTAANADLVQQGTADVQWFVGNDNTLPLSASTVVFTTGTAAIVPTQVTASCSNKELVSGLVASWSILNNNYLSVAVTLRGKQSWFVGVCDSSILDCCVLIVPLRLPDRIGFGWSTKEYADMVGGDVVIGRFGLLPAFAVSEYTLLGKICTDASSLEHSSGDNGMPAYAHRSQ